MKKTDLQCEKEPEDHVGLQLFEQKSRAETTEEFLQQFYPFSSWCWRMGTDLQVNEISRELTNHMKGGLVEIAKV